MSTPEGKVKDQVKKILAMHRPYCYAHWPVQNGMGAPTLDCVGAIYGHAFAIETKAPGNVMTVRQRVTADIMRKAGVRVFEIDGRDGSYGDLLWWLGTCASRGMIEDGISEDNSRTLGVHNGLMKL